MGRASNDAPCHCAHERMWHDVGGDGHCSICGCGRFVRDDEAETRRRAEERGSLDDRIATLERRLAAIENEYMAAPGGWRGPNERTAVPYEAPAHQNTDEP